VTPPAPVNKLSQATTAAPENNTKKRKADQATPQASTTTTPNSAGSSAQASATSGGAIDEKRPAKVANTGYTLLVKARAVPIEENDMKQFLNQNLAFGTLSCFLAVLLVRILLSLLFI
jgi:hypothetical protein